MCKLADKIPSTRRAFKRLRTILSTWPKVKLLMFSWGAFTSWCMFTSYFIITRNDSLVLNNKLQLSLTHQSVVMVACAGDCGNHTLTRNYTWAVPYDTTLSTSVSSSNIIQTLLSLIDVPISANKNNWIGVISLVNPISSSLNMSLVDMMLTDERLINDGVQVLGFIDISSSESSFSEILEDSCPEMMQILRYILLAINEDLEKIASMSLPSPVFPIFHGEFFATRPDFFYSFIEWLKPVTELLASKPRLQHFLQTKSDDPMNDSMSPCLLPLPQLLVSYYFNANMASIVTNKQYSKRLELHSKNSEFHTFMKNFNVQTVSNITSVGVESKPIIFILSHNEESVQKAVQQFSKFSWAYPYIIPSTYYFETHFYSHILPGIMDLETVDQASWIGSISWKTYDKANPDLMNLMLVDPKIDADVLAFWDRSHKSLWEETEYYHPGLMDLLVYVLKSIGEKMGHIDLMHLGPPAFRSFYGTYLAVRPQHIRVYVEWLTTVIKFIESDRKAQNMIWKDSKYDTSSHASRQVFDLSYYPMHPFLCERLVQYFFNSRGYKIMGACEYRDLKALPHECTFV